MQENLKLFAERTPETFEEAVGVVLDHGQSELLTLSSDDVPDFPNPNDALSQSLLLLASHGRINVEDLILLNGLLDSFQEQAITIDDNELIIDRPFTNFVIIFLKATLLGLSELQLELELRQEAKTRS